MYQPHHDERIETAFQRFLGVVRGVQLLHDNTRRPEVNVKVYTWTHDGGGSGRTFWMLSCPSKSKNHLMAAQQYCFIVRTPVGVDSYGDTPHGQPPTGTILGVRGGSPHLDRSLGSLFGLSAHMARREPPDVGFLHEPNPEYFMDFCGPDKVGERYQRQNDTKKREHEAHLRKQMRARSRPPDPVGADLASAFADLVGPAKRPGPTIGTLSPHYVRPNPRTANHTTEAAQAWDQMLLRKKLRSDLDEAGASPDWLNDFLDDVEDEVTSAGKVKTDVDAKAAIKLDHTFFDDL
jgi:hypothetical protein